MPSHDRPDLSNNRHETLLVTPQRVEVEESNRVVMIVSRSAGSSSNLPISTRGHVRRGQRAGPGKHLSGSLIQAPGQPR
jgi:hypothetical protein